MYLRSKMKLYFRVIGPLSVQIPFRLRQVNQVPVFIRYNICLFKADKVFDLLFRTSNPACLVERQGIKLAGSSILLQKAVLNNFKLQIPYAPNNFTVTAMLRKQLCNPFI